MSRKAWIPREKFPRSILVANVTRMSLTCYEELACVGRVHEDVTRMLRGNCFRGRSAGILIRLLYIRHCAWERISRGLANRWSPWPSTSSSFITPKGSINAIYQQTTHTRMLPFKPVTGALHHGPLFLERFKNSYKSSLIYEIPARSSEVAACTQTRRLYIVTASYVWRRLNSPAKWLHGDLVPSVVW